MDALPDELLLNIFERLPIKTIGSCILVKKHWLPLIKSPSFVSSYSDKNKTNSSIIFWRFWRGYTKLELRSDDNRFRMHKRYTLPGVLIFNALSFNENYICSCNGLLCFPKKDNVFMLWNPTVNKLLTLPKPTLIPLDIYEQSIGFWFSSPDNDFKVIRILCFKEDQFQTLAEIFSLSTNSWKVISVPGPRFKIVGPSLPLLNGAVHWIADYDNVGLSVLCFDVNAEVFRKIDLHKDMKGGVTYLTIAAYKESSIAVCCHFDTDDRDVWLMNEYGNVESWTQVWWYDDNRLPSRVVPLYEYAPFVIGIRKNGQILWEVLANIFPDEDENKNVIISTDFASGKNKKLKVVGMDYFDYGKELRYFEESLVLLDNANAVSL